MKKRTFLISLLAVAAMTCIPISAADELENDTAIEEVKPQEYAVTIANGFKEYGLALTSHTAARPGDTVIIGAFEKEFSANNMQFRYEFCGWASDADVRFTFLNETLAYFTMPESDVEIRPIFRVLDITEYYDWESVIGKIKALRNGGSLEVDMGEELTVPDSVLQALSGKNADVTFTTNECTFTLNGKNMVYTSGDLGLTVTAQESDLPKAAQKKVGDSELCTVKVSMKADFDTEITLKQHVAVKSGDVYVYLLKGSELEYVAFAKVNGSIVDIPVSVGGTYIITTEPIHGDIVSIPADSSTVVPVQNGNIIELSAVIEGNLVFKPKSTKAITYETYTNRYTDIRASKYKSAIDFVSARELMTGITETMFAPNSPVTVNDIAFAIAKIRGVPDKDAMLYCKQAGIFEDEYPNGYILTRNELSSIMTSLVKQITENPKLYGDYSMSGFKYTPEYWTNSKLRELESHNNHIYNKKADATRAEAAYLFASLIETIVAGG